MRRMNQLSNRSSQVGQDLKYLGAAQVTARRAAWQAVVLAAQKPSTWLEQGLELALWIVKWTAVTYGVVLGMLALMWLWVGGLTFSAHLSSETLERLHHLAAVLVLICIPFSRWRLPGVPLVSVWQRNYSAALYKAMALSVASEDPATEHS